MATDRGASAGGEAVPPVNEIRLCGRISSGPMERDLPSGTRVVTFRLVVTREPTVMTRGSRQRSDWFECTAWAADHRRRCLRWTEGDVVEVSGAVRRRHYRTTQGAGSVVEVEVLAGRRMRRTAGVEASRT